jgi:hypothetical protein
VSKDKQIVITDTENKSNNFKDKSNKQIEEMAKDMCEYYYEGTCYQDKKPCDCKCEIFTDATYLYAKGYHKASEVAREIITDLENGIDGLLKVYMEERNKECATDTPLAEYISGKIDAYSSVKFRLAELKKKYTEGGE